MSQREQFAPGVPAQDGFIPLSVPEIRGNEWQYIKECLDSNWVSSVGSFVDRFEQMMAEVVSVQYGVATVNGTAALHVSLLVAGVQPGDEVLVSSLTFIAPANAIRYVGAWPVFVDAEPTYWQMDPQKVEEFLEEGCRWENGALTNKATGRPVKAILPVHILGHPCDMEPIVALARKYNLVVIEDATESLGARYKGQPTGCLGDIACFSFNGNKIITTGGGGMLVTNNAAWAQQARYLTTQAKDDPVEYIHSQVGYNYRLTNVLAAMGCAQLEQLADFVATKRGIAQRYAEALAGVAGIRPMVEAPWAWSTFWLYTILVDETAYGLDSRGLMGRLKEAGVQARPLWQPGHLSPAHQGAFTVGGSVAAQLNHAGLSLPCSIGLSLEEQQRVIAVCAYLA
ncbi:MAG: LegC family aminotransferase [Chloroflexi bacterium]|nr:LegC family aminotransferase [Chloroflexota bacterium]